MPLTQPLSAEFTHIWRLAVTVKISCHDDGVVGKERKPLSAVCWKIGDACGRSRIEEVLSS